MYIVTSSAGLCAETPTAETATATLGGHLREHLPARPVGWTITSPWGLVHEGRANLNGAIDRTNEVVAAQMQDVAQNLAHEAADTHQSAAGRGRRGCSIWNTPPTLTARSVARSPSRRPRIDILSAQPEVLRRGTHRDQHMRLTGVPHRTTGNSHLRAVQTHQSCDYRFRLTTRFHGDEGRAFHIHVFSHTETVSNICSHSARALLADGRQQGNDPPSGRLN
jgi:hypothetical protein